MVTVLSYDILPVSLHTQRAQAELAKSLATIPTETLPRGTYQTTLTLQTLAPTNHILLLVHSHTISVNPVVVPDAARDVQP